VGKTCLTSAAAHHACARKRAASIANGEVNRL
jgi:hypothetical protein